MPGCQELSIYAGLLKTIKIIWPFMQSEPSIMYVSPLSPFCPRYINKFTCRCCCWEGIPPMQLSNYLNVEIQIDMSSENVP